MKPYSKFAAVVLALIAIVQLLRFLLGWEITVNGMSIPLWGSAVVCILFLGLATMVWREARR